jgi:tRNA(fMet)-specific endonuclease VapC
VFARRGVKAVVSGPVSRSSLSATREENMTRLSRGLAHIKCWPFDRNSAEAYGRIAADLRRRGRPMQVVDVMVAAIASTFSDCIVITRDSDLLAIPGLRVENWMTNSTSAS